MQIGFRVITLFACFILTGMSAQAQTYPSKPVRIVVPLPAGGAVDTIIRAVGQRLSDIWGQQIVIENRSGANTQIGAEAVARSAPDGYTLLATAETTFVVNPYLYPKLSYGAADFVPVIGIGRADQALNVHASVAANSVAEMIAMAKARPGAINYGSIGIGSSSHLNTVLFEMMTGVKLTPVHYRGGAPAISDLVGGHIPMLFISFPSGSRACEGGTHQDARRRRQQTPRVAAGRSDHRRNRSRLRSFLLVRPICAGGDAEGYCCEDQRRRAECVRQRGIPAELPHSVRLRADHLFAGGVSDYVTNDAVRWGKVIKDADVKVE